MRGNIEQTLKDNGVGISNKIETNSYILEKNGKSMLVQYELLDEYWKVETGEYQEVDDECLECSCVRKVRQAVLRDPTDDEKLKQDDWLVKDILDTLN